MDEKSLGGTQGGRGCSEAEERFASGPHMKDTPVQECIRFRTSQVLLSFLIKIQNIHNFLSHFDGFLICAQWGLCNFLSCDLPPDSHVLVPHLSPLTVYKEHWYLAEHTGRKLVCSGDKLSVKCNLGVRRRGHQASL